MIRRLFTWFTVDPVEPLVWVMIPHDHNQRVLWCWIDGFDEFI